MIEKIKKIKGFFKPPKPVETEIATISKDIDIFAGWIRRLENPDPVVIAKGAGRGIKLYDEVGRDAHAFSVLQTRILAVVGKDWSIVPAGGHVPARGKKAAETLETTIAHKVESVLTNCNFDQCRRELLKSDLYGYYGTEIMWKQKKDGDITIAKFYGKHPRRIIFTPQREPRLLTPSAMIEGEELPPRKFIILSFGDSDNPYGEGLGQKLWFPVWFKKHGVKFWMIFLEKFGMPTVMGKYPDQKKNDRGKLLEAIDAMQAQTGIAIPEEMTLDFLEAARSGTATYGEMCEYMDKQISKAVLGQTLTTEVGKQGGAYAASKTHDEVRQDIIEADADLLDTYLNETLITWIVDYNFWGVTEYPRIVTHAGKKPDLLAQSEIDKNNIESGAKIPLRWFYETYGYPEPEEGEEVVERAAPSTNPFALAPNTRDKNKPGQPEFSEKAPLPPEQKTIESLIANGLKEAQSAFSALTEPIKKLIKSGAPLDEIKEKIFSEYEHMDTGDLEEILVDVMFTAHMHGRKTIADIT